MSMTLTQLREEVFSLPYDERRDLFEAVRDSLDPQELALHPEWLAELSYRSTEYKAGQMGGISLEEFEIELDEPLNKC